MTMTAVIISNTFLVFYLCVVRVAPTLFCATRSLMFALRFPQGSDDGRDCDHRSNITMSTTSSKIW